MTSQRSGKPSLATVLSWLLFFGWAGLVLWASLDSAPFRPLVRILSWDKLQHALAYALLTLFGGFALRTLFPRHPWRCWGAAFLFSACYGGVVELLQHTLTRHRRGDPYDLLADLLGSLVVVVVAVPLERWRRVER